jgi:hypothetical protein
LTICSPESDGAENHTSGKLKTVSQAQLPKNSIQAVVEVVLDPNIILMPDAKHFIEWVTFPRLLEYILHTYPNAGAHLSMVT